jgi:hypothetical protein
MHAGSGLGANIARMGVAGVATNAFLFLANLLIVRAWGLEVHGHLAWAVAVLAAGVLVCDLGIVSRAGVRRIASLRERRPGALSAEVSRLLTLEWVLGALAGVTLAVAAVPLSRWEGWVSPWMVALAGLWVFLRVASLSMMMLHVAFERMGEMMIIAPVADALRLAWVVACALVGAPSEWLFVGWTVAAWGEFAVALWRTGLLTRREHLRLRPRMPSLARLRALLTHSAPFYVHHVALLGLSPVVILLLSARAADGAEQVSSLQRCFALAMVCRLLPVAAAAALFPRLTRLHAARHATDDLASAPRQQASDAEQRGADVLADVCRVMAAVAVCFMGVYVAGGQDLLDLLYGASRAPGLGTLLPLVLAISIDGLTYQVDQHMLARGKAWILAALAGGRYAVIVLLLLLLPRGLDADTAAATVLLSSIGLAVLTTWVAGAAVARRIAWTLARLAVLQLGLLSLTFLPLPYRLLAVPVSALSVSALRLVRPADLRSLRSARR